MMIFLQRFVAIYLGVMSLMVFKSLAQDLEKGEIANTIPAAPPKFEQWYILGPQKTTCQTCLRICARRGFTRNLLRGSYLSFQAYKLVAAQVRSFEGIFESLVDFAGH